MTEIGLREFIAKCRLGVSRNDRSYARPQSSLVGIAVTEELEILFDTVKRSRKYGNLIAQPSCSFAMGWEGEQTVQYEGEAAELLGGELERLQPIYFARWPECRAHLTWPGIVYFVVRPRWIRYSDYDQQPPLIQEFVFDHLSR